MEYYTFYFWLIYVPPFRWSEGKINKKLVQNPRRITLSRTSNDPANGHPTNPNRACAQRIN